MKNPNRTRLARWSTGVERHVAYRIPEGIEVETSQNYEVVRRRVFFDDVVMVTLHREHSPIFLALTGITTLFLFLIGFLILFSGTAPMSMIFFIPGTGVLVAFLLRLFFGVDVITVIGRRSKAAIRFGIVKSRVRGMYGSLCSTVAETHRRLAAEYAAETPAEAPVVDLPPGPPA